MTENDDPVAITGKEDAIDLMRKVAGATACSDCWIIAASPETAHQEVLAQNAHDQLYQATPDVYLSPQQLAIQNIDTFS